MTKKKQESFPIKLMENAKFYITEQGDKSLRAYLGKVFEGQPKIYTAPFAKGTPIEEVMNQWQETLKSIEDKWPTLYEFEMDLAAKVGPLSVQAPLKNRMGDIEDYYTAIRKAATPISTEAMNNVVREFSGIRGLRLRSQTATVENMKKSTNSGTPYFTKRRNVTTDSYPVNIRVDLKRPEPVAWMSINHEPNYIVAAVVGWRGQEGGPNEEDVKQRVVWMFPFSVNIRELQVYQPLIEGVQKLGLVPAWVSMELVDKRITDMFDTKSREDLVVCTDFTKFDQHFNMSLQRTASDILKELMMPSSESAIWLASVFPVKYIIPMIIDSDDHYITTLNGRHGMASGSGGTNADETLVHRALQYEAAMLVGKRLNPNSQCLGDDGILTYPGITVEDVVKAYSSHGLDMNPEKQYASTQDCVYLRRWHHTDYRIDGVCAGVYSTMRAIGRLRYLERFMDPEYWSPEMVALRQLSIIENCKNHPLRDQFADFCMARDKYRLGIDIPGFLDDIERYQKEAIDHMPDFLGYTKTLQGESKIGMNSWWIVNYLKSHK